MLSWSRPRPMFPCAGQYTASPGQACQPCPAGTYSSRGNGGVGSTGCSPCGVGLTSLSGSSVCSSCPLGSVTSSTGQAVCTPCRPGPQPAGPWWRCVAHVSDAFFICCCKAVREGWIVGPSRLRDSLPPTLCRYIFTFAPDCLRTLQPRQVFRGPSRHVHALPSWAVRGRGRRIRVHPVPTVHVDPHHGGHGLHAVRGMSPGPLLLHDFSPVRRLRGRCVLGCMDSAATSPPLVEGPQQVGEHGHPATGRGVTGRRLPRSTFLFWYRPPTLRHPPPLPPPPTPPTPTPPTPPVCPVAPGWYATNVGALNCNPCSGGDFSANPASTSCSHCGPGQFSPMNPNGNTGCTPCPAGTYSNTTRIIRCLICAPGRWANSSVAPATSCQDCPAGKAASARGSGSCTTCPVAKWSGPSALYCASCPSGKTSPAGSGSSTACVSCVPGQIFNASLQCEDCVPGG
jgi:hypothetical protein